MKSELNPCFILHQKPYRETSLLLDVFSQQYGRCRLLARGARQASRKRTNYCQPYQGLLISWSGCGDLQTVTAVEEIANPYQLKKDATLCGLYINELLVRLLPLHETEIDVFSAYQHTLSALQDDDNNEWALRLFEKHLLQHLGYGLNLEVEASTGEGIKETKQYYYQADFGLLTWQKGMPQKPISGRSITHLINEMDFDLESLLEIKQLMRSVIHYYLGGKPLKSRQLFAQLQRYAGK